MALTEETIQDKIEIVGDYKMVQVRTAVVIKRDGKEISRSFSRHVLAPCSSSKDGDTWTHTDTDISSEATEVQAVANAVWTDTVKANYKTFVESQEV